MPGGATARLFVAAQLPLAVRERLAAWARTAAVATRAAGVSREALRLLDAESLHLTLCFLGSRPVGEIGALAAALAPAVEDGLSELSVGAPLWLPERRPHALAVEIHDREGELAGLQSRLERSLAGASAWLPERRRFRPHVTVARVRGQGPRRRRARREPGAPAATGRPAGSLPATPELAFAVEAVVLYRSWLGPEGTSYQALDSCALPV